MSTARALLISAICLVSAAAVTASEQTIPSLTTESGLALSNIVVTSVEPDGIRYRHAEGLGKIALDELPAPVAESLGDTPAQLEQFAAQRAAAQQAQAAPAPAETRFAEFEAEIKDLKARALSGPTEMFQSGRSSQEVQAFREASSREIAAKEQRLSQLKALIAKLDASGASEKKTRRLIDAVFQREVFPGMPAAFARVAWGQPREVDTLTDERGQRQSWWYGGDRVLWIEDGAVETVSH